MSRQGLEEWAPHLAQEPRSRARPHRTAPKNAAATPGAVRAVSVMRPHTRALLSHEGTE